MSRLASLSACALLLCAAAVGRAQIFYEPVQYQYGSTEKFYYGGSDPRVFAYGEWSAQVRHWSRATAPPRTVGMASDNFAVVNERVIVYADALPYCNAALSGVTPEDARDQALAAVPRYFRKGDLLAAGIPTAQGLIVPAQAQPRPQAAPRPAAADSPGVILIIPARPRPARGDASVARADVP